MFVDPDGFEKRRADALRSWARFLHPDELRSNLIRASVFLTAYELLRHALIDLPESFFSDGCGEKGRVLGEEYRTEVLSRHKMPFFASAQWFRQLGAIDERDIERLREIRDHRNFVAHNTLRLLDGTGVDECMGLLDAIAEILGKIDVWWLREVEMTTNPDFDDLQPNSIDGIYSTRMAVLDLLRDVAKGNDEGLQRLHEQLTKLGVYR